MTTALLTYKDAAKVLGVSERTVWQLVRDGKLVHVKLGRVVRIDPADLQILIQRSKSAVKLECHGQHQQ